MKRMRAGNSAGEAARERARARVVDGARRHFLRQGFRGVTMDDLAAELGVSKKTLYKHFPSKTALLEAVLDNKLQEVRRDLGELTARRGVPVGEALAALVACVQRHAEEFGPPFVRDMRRAAPELFERVAQQRARLIGESFGKVIGAGQRGGIIRRDIPVQVIIDALLGAMQAVVNPTKLGECGLTPQQGFSMVMRIILVGVAVRKGRVKR